MGVITGITRGRQVWTPRFVQEIDQKKCIGCGRCFKVCTRNVLGMIGFDEDGEVVDAQDDEAERKVMSIQNGDLCIGCGSCAKVCPKGCYSHAPLEG
ncbi:MAG: ferredoxin III, nif-specific [Pseudomonadota bacterium]